MMRRLWLVSAIGVPVMVLAIPGLLIAGIWTSSGRLMATSGVLLFVSLPVVPLFWIWTADARPMPNLPRKDRRRLRDAERRVRFEAEVQRLEREAGLS